MLMASFTTAAQNTAPAWVGARALGAYLLVFQGGLALGSVLWGAVAARAGTRPALIIAAAALVGGLPATMRWPMTAGATLDLRPSLHWPEPRIEVEPQADEGPAQVVVEYRIDPEQRRDFSRAMRALVRVRRRDGAIQGGVFRDAADPSRYVEAFLVESRVEHFSQHQRGTVADRAIEDRARAFHRGDTPPGLSLHLRAHEGGDVMTRILLGLFVGLLIGAGCRWFDIPPPGPPTLVGALLVVAIAAGYTVADRYIARHPTTTQHLCGGPTRECAGSARLPVVTQKTETR